MGEKRNYAALDWIIGEISETLNDARQSLEAYVEDPRDSARIRFCLTHIHQVLGSLQMVEFHGASLFAEEMEGLAESLMNGTVVNEKEAQEALMRSLLQLPIYLEQVKSSQEDHPGAVLPLLNDLRAVRKQSYLSETNLFTPDLSSAEHPRGERHEVLGDALKLKQIVHKLREMYQYAAASVLRGIKIDENLGYIEKVLTRLEGLTRGTKSHPVWQVSAALSEALVRDDVELSIAVRGLLRYVAREIRILEEHCPAAFDAPVRDSLLRNLLYYVALAQPGGPRAQQVKRQYKLEKAILGGAPAGSVSQDPSMVSPPGPDAIRSVVVALQDELNTCKHLLDSALSGHGSLSDIEQMMPYVKRIGDTLAVLGIGEMRKQMMQQHEVMSDICEAGTYSDIQLIDIAGALASIENRLEAISKGAGKTTDFANLDEREIEIDSAKEAVLNECRTGLEKVKQAIVDSLSAQWDPSHLPAAIETLHDIRGGLKMVPLERAAMILESCSDYIANTLSNSEKMPGDELQTLAEAIASVDYYIERLLAGLGDDLDTYLQLAEKSLTQLGYEFAQFEPAENEVDESAAQASTSTSAPAQSSAWQEDQLHWGEEAAQPELETKPELEERSASQGDSAELDITSARPAITDDMIADHERAQSADDYEIKLESIEQDSGADQETDDSDAAAQDPTADASDQEASEFEPVGALLSAEEEDGLSVQSDGEPESTEYSPAESESDEDNEIIDDEIIEIFIEEAAEVQQTLAESFPQWCENLDDSDALTTVRRSFHTLKGSGRMVEALDVGELAWAVESMLNRVIDGSVEARSSHLELIKRVMAIIPDLVEAFKNRTANPHQALQEQYIEWAGQLAKGEVPSELSGAASLDLEAASAELDESVSDNEQIGSDQGAEEDANLDGRDGDEDHEDQVLWDIFASEANTHLQVVASFLEEMDRKAPLYSPPSDSVQRALHTLKGSAHMAGVTSIARLITPLEGFIKEMRSYQLKVDTDILQLIRDADEYTRQGLACIERKATVEIPKLEQFEARVKELYELHITPLLHMQDAQAQSQKQVDPRMLAVIMAEEMRLLLDADLILEQWQTAKEDNNEQVRAMQDELVALDEAAQQANLPMLHELAATMVQVYQGIIGQHVPLNAETYEVLRGAHENVLDMVDQVAASQDVKHTRPEVMQGLEGLLDIATALRAAELTDMGRDEDSLELEGSLELEDSPESEEPIEGSLLEADDDEQDDSMTFDAEDIIVVDDESSSLTESDQTETPQAETDEEEALISFEDDEALDQAVKGLDAAEEDWADGQDHLSVDAQTDDEAEIVLSEEDFDDEAIAAALVDTSDDEQIIISEEKGDEEVVVDLSEDDVEAVAEGEDANTLDAAEDTDAGEDEEHALIDGEVVDVEDLSNAAHEDELEDSAPVDTAAVDSAAVDAASVDTAAMTLAGIAHVDEDDFDADILEIFLEEAVELVEELDVSIHEWESDAQRDDIADNMKRALHTLKGGARLSGLMNLGELTHEFESFLIQNDSPQAHPNFFQIILGYQDRIHTGVKAVKARLDGEPIPQESGANTLQDALNRSVDDAPDQDPSAESSASDEPTETEQAQHPAQEPEKSADEPDDSPLEQIIGGGQVVPFARKAVITPEISEDGDFVTAAPKPEQTQTTQPQKRQGSQEMIKVSSDLLEELVNLAGETSISRGRLEQQVSDLSGAVDEVDGTLKRLNEQLRRLDIETEAQVLFRQEQMAAHEGFDPLEMDRYSHLQQLTRSLMESASDLLDLKSTLNDKIRDTETMLLQQSRVNSALQEGLMRSRMVPFSRLVPRLRRIVRQVASELGKHVNFELDNVEGEMDRSVLERMVAPLEHMLRNAVDHGIEMPDVRVKNGKPETGRILLSLAREGGDILLRLADDGRGINLDRVKEKAIERGLMTADAELSDHAIMQFILQAGFSTAENVTQISGRGVGMDVVAAEIKQLGGSIVIDSKAGVGSQFTVRLPFTVSVNRALMVQLNNETYAIPLNTIEGIVRVSPFELEHYYSHPDARFEYAGENYQVRHLGSILNGSPKPKLDGHVLPMPVILVRSAQNTMALQVDGLMGSREIVVKSLGPQFAAVQGLSGATVMGDGSVVVIVDPHALVRREVALALSEAKAIAPAPSKETQVKEDNDRVRTIMVVDDSVTVRKVTTRFLEREGFNVITAKDGVDALQVLQEELPDLMLLDIEMPRMDGFEVAKNVRSTSRLKHLPIIMITSRTGDKHRQHALSIGVNEYMGKPYQEEHLLRTMESMLYNRKDKQA